MSDTESDSSNDDMENARANTVKNYLNILLLGQSEIEHSTFINALANYLTHENFKAAEEGELLVLVPTKVNIRDDNEQIQEITVSYTEAENPSLETTLLNSKEFEVYVFPINGGQTTIRLIDTSTVKDATEIDEDKINYDDIVQYISSLQTLDAICFDFKSVPSKQAIWFQYSIAQILSGLDDSLSKKLLFVFSIDNKSSECGSSDTFSIDSGTCPEFVGKIPIFRINNEFFKYLAAIKNDAVVGDDLKACVRQGWDASAEQCRRLLNHIEKIPRDLRNVQNVKQNIGDILQVYKPVAELSSILAKLAPPEKVSAQVEIDIAKAMKKTDNIINAFPVGEQLSQSVKEAHMNQESKMASDEELEPEIKLDVMDEEQEINLLLLGATGVGKSTFINSVANYLTYPDMKTAESEKLLALIPSTFSFRGMGKKTHTITVGSEDNNEFLDTGVSATQDVKTYVFPICEGRVKVRLIDTPGMGDTRGIRQDDVNSENILGYIGQLKELHAVCFLFDSNQARQTVFFQYCMAQIFSRLDKSASRNIIFCFTKTRGSDYSGGETLRILKKVSEDIKKRPPYVNIPVDSNVFCFDNECFKYLAAVHKKIKVDEKQRDNYEESWNYSANECWKLIKYILGDDKNPRLEPHLIQNTNAINEARRMIINLCQPLAEISQLINHNMNILQRHEDNLQMENQSVQALKDQLFMPLITLEIIELPNPVTVCTSSQCAEVYQVGGRNKWHYKQRCHDPCYLQDVPREIIGSPELVHCWAMKGTPNCRECGCSFQVHMHVYYMTETKHIKEKDPIVEQNINSKKELMKKVRMLVEEMQTRKEELDSEHQIIITTCARFSHFLQNNAITPFSDTYKEYIEYLINQERSLGKACNKESLDYLQKLLKEYEEIKASFDHALNLKANVSSDVTVTPEGINDSIRELFKLKHTGKKIKELYECQQKARQREYKNSEYVSATINRYGNKCNKNKNGKGAGDTKNNPEASNNFGYGNHSQTAQAYMNYNNYNTHEQHYSHQQTQIDQESLKNLIGITGRNASGANGNINPVLRRQNFDPRLTNTYGMPRPMAPNVDPPNVFSESKLMNSQPQHTNGMSGPLNNYQNDQFRLPDNYFGYLPHPYHNTSGYTSFPFPNVEGPVSYGTYQQNERDAFHYPANSPFGRDNFGYPSPQSEEEHNFYFDRLNSGHSTSGNYRSRDDLNDRHQKTKEKSWLSKFMGN